MQAVVSEQAVRDQVREYVVKVTGLATPPGDDEALVEKGFVASVRMLDLVGFLEDTFKIRLRPVDLVPENLATISLIAGVVETRLKSKR